MIIGILDVMRQFKTIRERTKAFHVIVFCKRIEFERKFVHFVNSKILDFISLLILRNQRLISIVRYKSYYRIRS